MNRIELLPENDFVTAVKKLRADLEQIKNAQRTGKDIWKPHIVEAVDGFGVPTVYDLVANTPDGFGGYEQETFLATMTADNQDEVFAVPVYKFFYNTPGNPPASTDDISGFSYLDFDPASNVAKKIAYSGYFGDNVYPFDHVVYLKVYFYATDSGVLQVVAT